MESWLNASTLKFSLAISGHGRLMPRFVRDLKLRFRHITIYDRNEEKNSPPSTVSIPAHPKVADVDAEFALKGNWETIFISSLKGNYFFNYNSDPKSINESAMNLLFRRILTSVEELV